MQTVGRGQPEALQLCIMSDSAPNLSLQLASVDMMSYTYLQSAIFMKLKFRRAFVFLYADRM